MVDPLKALRLIPGGSSTMAKSPLRGFPPHTPSYAVSASGSTFVDDTGRSWIDCDMALGTVIWGYARPEIDDALIRQLRRGHIFSVPATIEIELAECLLDRLRYEAIRFCKDGADAVAAAVRIARAATGRERVACGTYHGWLDWSAFHHYGGDLNLGIPRAVADLTVFFPSETYGAYAAVADVDLAAVIVCPEHWLPHDLQLLRDDCRRRGTVLVFDEVKSGMRWGRQGVSGEVGVRPDLLCLSKGLANGLALAALMGSRELMQRAEDVRFSSTHAGECLAIAAALAGESLLAATPEWPSWRTAAQTIIHELAAAAAEQNMHLVGGPGLFAIRDNVRRASPAFRAHFVKTLASEGIFSTGSVALCDVHTGEQLRAIADAAGRAVRQFIKK